MKPSTSAYSKMYLVTPSVYEKLLSCLDEADKRMTEKLNAPEEAVPERPATQYIEELQQQDLLPGEEQQQLLIGPVEPAEIMEQQQPLLDTQIEGLPAEPLIDYVEPEIHIQEEQMPLQQQVVQQPPVQQQVIPPIIRSQVPQQLVDNPLRQPCPIEDTERVIPRILHYNPKKKSIIKPNLKSIQKVITLKTNPARKMQFNLPPTGIRGPAADVKPLLVASSTPTNFQCKICLKYFDRKWGLRRHVDSVHKNMKNVRLSDEDEAMRLASAAPESDIPMTAVPSTSFTKWGDKNLRKRTQSEAKLRMKLPKSRPSDDYFEEAAKQSKQSGNGKPIASDFENWINY